MTKKVLIIGNHPIYIDLSNQYHMRGDEVVHLTIEDLECADIATFKEIALLADYERNPTEADNSIMGALQKIADKYTLSNNGKRLLCHLLLRSQSLLQMIRLEGFRQEIDSKLEINPFTIEDQWSQSIALGLDREPITIQSEKTIHLVIFGMTSVGEQVAINAAHVCHFPNYTKKDHSLRTRITVIDEHAFEKSQEWIMRYKYLFENSHYRYIDAKKRPAVTKTIRPIYQEREDFVDVEWEFVSASPFDGLVRNKISQWASSKTQLLTIVFANGDADSDINNALHQPEAVVANNIPVYVYMQSDEAFQQIKHSDRTSYLIPFGMADHGYDVNVPLLKMAKNVNYVYDSCYNDNIENWDGHMRFSIEIKEKEKEKWWFKKSAVKRMSNIYNAMTIGIKMHSMGFKEDEWDKFYDLSKEDIEMLAEVEHNRWSVEELILGFRPCTDDELKEIAESIEAYNEKRIKCGYNAVKDEKTQKDIYKEKKIHYDLRAYKELCPDGTGKPVQVYDRCLSACIPLIAKESKGGKI